MEKTYYRRIKIIALSGTLEIKNCYMYLEGGKNVIEKKRLWGRSQLYYPPLDAIIECTK